MIKTLHKRFVLVVDGDVCDFADLVESLNTVLDELDKFHCRLSSISDGFDDHRFVVILGQELVSTLEISADADFCFVSYFVRRQLILGLLDFSV